MGGFSAVCPQNSICVNVQRSGCNMTAQGLYQIRMTQRCAGIFDEDVIRSWLGNGDLIDLDLMGELFSQNLG